MVTQLSTRTIIDRNLLSILVDTRLAEAKALFEADLYTGSIWVGGHAVECQLKLRICQTLDLQELPETFKVHDLEALLLHSGVQSKLHSYAAVETN